ncbi:hypothetical protein BH10BAC2_BH10BAC2_07020 [soil metagenome]
MNKILHNSFITKSVLTFIITMISITSAFSIKYDKGSTSTQVKVVKCYPNPATSVINFEFPSGVAKNSVIQIYSFTGKKITDVAVSSGKITVILDNDYYRGVYVFQLRDKNGKIIETGKFQVVR